MVDSRPNKQAAPGGGDAALVLGIVLLLLGGLVLVVLTWGAAAIAGLGYGSPRGWLQHPTGPRWSGTATVAAGCEAVLLAGLLAPAVWVVLRSRRSRVWTDPLARYMSSRRDLAGMTEADARQDAARKGALSAGVGVPLGRSVAFHVALFGTYEWSQIWIIGTRGGKTRRIAVRQLVTHGGPAISTSNKRDLHDLTRGPRSEVGHVWVNDPQEIVREPAVWWWNPLTFITTVERAEKLVALWAASRTSEDTSGVDPYFEPEGRSLAATLLVAAARGGESITRLPDWLTGDEPGPGVPDPREILRAHGFAMMAKDLDKLLRLDKGQRDGVYGTAMSFFRFLRDPRYVDWIAPRGAGVLDGRPQFDPAAFVRSTDTLYLLSKEGPGSARALTGALVAAVFAAAEDLSEQSGGRCPVPVLFELDEAANVCRWPELPALYSHAGGRGIILVTILQSAAQGEEAWGRMGFTKMWSATNILSVGRGLNDADNLADLSRLVGDRQVRDRSLSTGTRGHRTVGTQIRDERIFTEADLRALPNGRAIVFASGARAILLETIDFTDEPWGWKATASQQHYAAAVTERV